MSIIVQLSFVAIIVATSLNYLLYFKKSSPLVAESQKPKFWLYNDNPNYGVFDSIQRVILKLGFERKDEDTSSPDTMTNDWELLWSFCYFSPSKLPNLNFSSLRRNQKLNHIPGNFNFVSKYYLYKYTNSRYVPKGFSNLQQLQEYAKDHPETRYVQKNARNRGISLKNAADIDFSINKNGGNFAQVFVENPLTIEGHKFDINFYVGISSLNPLRVYYYQGNNLFRFCSVPYDHKNFSDTKTYVIDDTHLTEFMFKPFEKYLKMDISNKEAFIAIMRENGIDPQRIFDQAEDCIRTVLMQKENMMLKAINILKPSFGKHHFFELVRFDMMVDDQLNVHLMEVNQSPNLQAVGKVIKRKKLYENVLYNFLNMIGVGTYVEKKKIHDFSDGEQIFMGDADHMTVAPENCTKEICLSSCESSDCRLCWKCIPVSMRWDLRLAFIEHSNIGQMKRVVPPPNEILKDRDHEYWKNLTPNNKLYAEWIFEMCKRNKIFC